MIDLLTCRTELGSSLTPVSQLTYYRTDGVEKRLYDSGVRQRSKLILLDSQNEVFMGALRLIKRLYKKMRP